ncbi:MAG: carboxymuconolactone decarboxylase family protein [Actinoallomurus sp.]
MSRLNVTGLAPEVYQAFMQAEQAIRKGPLAATICELVKIRSSQINGCLFCIDMHTHEALTLGETLDRIFQLPAWRESQLYTEAERPRWPTPRPSLSSPTASRTRSGTR